MFDVVQKESKKMKKTKRVSFPFHISFQWKRILTYTRSRVNYFAYWLLFI